MNGPQQMMEIGSAMRLRLMAGLAATLVLSSASHAGVAEDLTAAIKKCAAITEDATRHACYDQLPTLLTSPAPVATAEAAPPAAAQPKAPTAKEEKDSADCGFSLFGCEPIPADHITATVESFAYDYGLFVVTLDNGQVWRQITAIGALARFSREKKDQVTIWRNSFGDDVLKIEGYHATFHVRRIK